MMAEYIEREKVLKVISEARELDDGWSSIDDIIDMAYKRIEDIPAADVRPERHGWWKEEHNIVIGLVRYDSLCICSVCEFWYNEDVGEKIFNFCPNCGAKMGGSAANAE